MCDAAWENLTGLSIKLARCGISRAIHIHYTAVNICVHFHNCYTCISSIWAIVYGETTSNPDYSTEILHVSMEASRRGACKSFWQNEIAHRLDGCYGSERIKDRFGIAHGFYRCYGLKRIKDRFGITHGFCGCYGLKRIKNRFGIAHGLYGCYGLKRIKDRFGIAPV